MGGDDPHGFPLHFRNDVHASILLCCIDYVNTIRVSFDASPVVVRSTISPPLFSPGRKGDYRWIGFYMRNKVSLKKAVFQGFAGGGVQLICQLIRQLIHQLNNQQKCHPYGWPSLDTAETPDMVKSDSNGPGVNPHIIKVSITVVGFRPKDQRFSPAPPCFLRQCLSCLLASIRIHTQNDGAGLDPIPGERVGSEQGTGIGVTGRKEGESVTAARTSNAEMPARGRSIK